MTTTDTRRSARPVRTGRIVAAVIAAVVVLAGVIAIVAGDDDDQAVPAGVEQVRPVEVEGTTLPTLTDGQDPAIGMTAPVLRGASFDGTPETTAGDGPRLLLFVAHWCPHCRREVPLLVSWAASGGVPDGVDVRVISTAVEADAPNYPPSTWLEDEDVPWPVIADDAAGTGSLAMGLPGFPYFVLLRADGTVAWRGSGEIDPTELATTITTALGV